MTIYRDTQARIRSLLKEDIDRQQFIKGLQRAFGTDPEDFHLSQDQNRIEAKFSRVLNHTPLKTGHDALGAQIIVIGTFNETGLNAHLKIWLSNFQRSSPKTSVIKRNITKISCANMDDFIAKTIEQIIRVSGETSFENPYMGNFINAIIEVLKNRRAGKNLSETHGLLPMSPMVQALFE